MKYAVRLTRDAEQDLLELDLEAAARALTALRKAFTLLELFPFSCRKARGAEDRPLLREMVIPFGVRGYVALFEIEKRHVTILAVRHQREDDYH